MQVNNVNCNCPKPQFGMAFRRPEGKAMSQLSEFVGLEKEINRKGFAQYIKELKNFRNYDAEFLPMINTVRVVDAKTEQVKALFPGNSEVSGFNHFSATKYPGRRWITEKFDPEQFLPYNFLQAEEKIEQLEAEALLKNQNTKFIDKII